MLPRWHLLFGVIFTLLVWIAAPQIHPVYLALIFFSSFLIDFDHYTVSLFKTKKWRLKDSLDYYKKYEEAERMEIAKGIRRKGNFHLFHTVEFHVFIGLFSIFFVAFFYIFIGMIFHSLVDLIDLLRAKRFHRQEYFFFNWLRKRF